jgi:hypothetical protein
MSSVLATLILSAAAQSSSGTINASNNSIRITGHCILSMVVNTGPVDFHCDDSETPESRQRLLSWFETTQYAQSVRKLLQQSQSVDSLDRAVNDIRAHESVTVAQVDTLKATIKSIETQQTIDRGELRHSVEELAESAQRQLSDAHVDVQKAFDFVNAQIDDNQSRLSTILIQLVTISGRLDRLENSVAFVLEKLRQGTLNQVLVSSAPGSGFY